MQKFRALIPEAASVIRDGQFATIGAENLVLGYLIQLKLGDKIPADCRIIQSNNLKVDQSMITGESEPVENSVIAQDKKPLEAKNIVFNGSLVEDGSCIAAVIRTGDETLIGSMVELTSDVSVNTSTLKADVEYFVKVIAVIALIQAVFIFVIGCARGLDPVTVFIQGFIGSL
jgi:sodium/potassium-transporting ATPase subunit alpha